MVVMWFFFCLDYSLSGVLWNCGFGEETSAARGAILPDGRSINASCGRLLSQWATEKGRAVSDPAFALRIMPLMRSLAWALFFPFVNITGIHHGILAAFTCPYADHLIYGRDEDEAVAGLAGIG